jgi:tetratricopeptide (TPR) repeat protein
VAEAALRAGDFTTALKELERAVELAPRNAMMFYNLAVVHQKRGDAIKALSPLQRAITLGLPEHLGPLAKTLEGELIYARDRARRSLSESVEWLQQQRPSALVAAGNFGGRFEFVHRGFVFNGSGCGLGGYEWRSEDIDPQNARQTVARALDH